MYCNRFTTAFGRAILQSTLNGRPAFRINNRRMLSIMHLVAMANSTGIKRVGQNVMNMAAVKRVAAGRFAIRYLPLLATEPYPISLCL